MPELHYWTIFNNKGFKSGRKIGEIQKIEKAWIENDFDLKKEDLNNLIKN